MEFFETSFVGKKGRIDNFYLVNVLDKIKCIDIENSKVKFSRLGSLRNYDSLVIDSTLVPEETRIFQLGESSSSVFVMDEVLKNAIKSRGLTGFEIIASENAGRIQGY